MDKAISLTPEDGAERAAPKNTGPKDAAPPLHIALIEPQIPQNTGNVARTCACTGAALHLVGPLGFTVSDAKLKRAGLDYWDKLNISYYKDLDDFLSRPPGPLWLFTTKAARRHTEAAYAPGCCLTFGREDAGLPAALLAAMPGACLRLPMRGALRSLNLSNTVAVGVYEALRQWGFEGMG